MPLPTDEESPWRALCAAYGIELADAEWYGVAWDDPIITRDPVIRYDAAIGHSRLVADDFRSPVVELSAGAYVCARWRGPVDRMTPIYHHLIYEWSREHGRPVDPSRPPFERFVRGPAGTDSRRVVTVDVYVPLRVERRPRS